MYPAPPIARFHADAINFDIGHYHPDDTMPGRGVKRMTHRRAAPLEATTGMQMGALLPPQGDELECFPGRADPGTRRHNGLGDRHRTVAALRQHRFGV
jgi:hypothetical protein